jgi:hypothetical protein
MDDFAGWKRMFLDKKNLKPPALEIPCKRHNTQTVVSLPWHIPAYGLPHKNTLEAHALATGNFLKHDSLYCTFFCSCFFTLYQIGEFPKLISLKVKFSKRTSIRVGPLE